MKLVTVSLVTMLGLFLSTTTAFAHVTVKPGEVGVGAWTNFVVSVPTEKETPTTQVRVLVPEGLQYVRPNVKPGWEINLVKSGEGESAKVTEIIWSGGSIPVDQRDEFVFNAQAPAKETTLTWKAYQTYEDGNIVAWDKSPKEVDVYEKKNHSSEENTDAKAPHPYSEVKIINDLKANELTTNESGEKENRHAYSLSIIALSLSALALGLQLFKRKQ